jgi:long-chain acyl-CoA synthetase
MFFTSGTTGTAKGVVLTHGALIDRARVASELEGLNDQDVAIAYLPPAWIGQNIFSYAQPMVVGYCICCPESSETMMADMREIGPTYFFAPPRVLEALLTQVTIRMEDASKLKKRIYDSCINLARRIGPGVLDGKPMSVSDSLAYKLADKLVYGPLRDVLGMGKLRVAYTAGEAIGPDLLMFFRSIGLNVKQLYGSTETSVLSVCSRTVKSHPTPLGQR